jgi:uncharacterized protein (DUF952 family)
MNANPEFVYRIITADDWAAAQESGAAPYGEDDQRDGFLHLSLRKQVLETAGLHYKNKGALLALEIPLAAISDTVKFETAPKRGEKFPHLYGSLTVDKIVRVIRLVHDGEDFRFEDEA